MSSTPTVNGTFVTDDLVIQRQQEERAEQAGRDEDVGRGGRGEGSPPEQRQIDERALAADDGMADEQHDQQGASDRHGQVRRVEPAGIAGLRHAVQEEGDPRREQQQAAEVESLAAPWGHRRQQPPRGDEREGPDRQVEVEDPAPVDRVDDRAAERRAEDRREQHRDADDAHHPSHSRRSGRLGQDRLADRQDHPGAKALDDPEGDERLERPGGPRQDGAG